MNNPAATGLDAVTFVTQRSTTQTVDSNGALANGLLIAEVTVSNGAVSIANASIQDRRLYINSTVDGWQQSNETWTYASATTITVPTGAAFKYAVGDKIRFIQSGSTKFMYVTGVADTLLTVNGGTDYTVANASIGSPCYSKRVSPVGFPGWFNYTPTWTNLTTTSATQASKFSMDGHTVTYRLFLPWGASTSISGGVSVSLPVTASSFYSTASYDGMLGTVLLLDQGTTGYMGNAITTASATTATLNTMGTAGTYINNSTSQISATTPHTLATTDQISGVLIYEAA